MPGLFDLLKQRKKTIVIDDRDDLFSESDNFTDSAGTNYDSDIHNEEAPNENSGGISNNNTSFEDTFDSIKSEKNKKGIETDENIFDAPAGTADAEEFDEDWDDLLPNLRAISNTAKNTSGLLNGESEKVSDADKKYMNYSDYDTENAEEFSESDNEDTALNIAEPEEAGIDNNNQAAVNFRTPDVSPAVVYKATAEDLELLPPISQETYSQTLEHMIGNILALNEEKNVSLSVFGAYAKLYSPISMSIITYQDHIFVGQPNTNKECWRIFWMMEDLLREKIAKEGPDTSVQVSLVKSFISNGIRYNTLLLTKEEIDLYASASGRKVGCNKTFVEEDLRLIVYGKNH